VNDASTDETVSVLADMEDSRIHIHSLPENQGVGAARNAAIRMSSGELASFLDDDDEYDENFLERTADVFSRGGPPGLTWTGVEFVRDESEVALRRRKSGRHPHGKRVQRPGGPNAILFQVDCHTASPDNEKYWRAWVRWMRHCEWRRTRISFFAILLQAIGLSQSRKCSSVITFTPENG